MKISIIIPVYKVEAYIERTLRSVINQIYADIEVILIDDASPDKSIDLAKKIINESNRKDLFKIISHQRNRGLSAARNTGIEAANGDYIYFLDSDDELYNNKSISILAENAIQTGAEVVIGNYMGIRPDSTYESKYTQKRILKNAELITAFVNGDVPITAWNKLIVRSLFHDKKLRFKENILNEDELFSYNLLFTNPTTSLIGETTYKYYIRQGSIMTTINYNRILSPVIVYEEVINAYQNIGGHNPILLKNFDHFAFKRYVAIFQSNADDSTKYQLYKRLRKAQSSIKGVGKMRYIYNCHLFMPTTIGYNFMRIVAKRYAKSRNLI